MDADIKEYLSGIKQHLPETYTLNNGIRVVIENYGDYPVATVGVLVPSGGRFENKQTSGLSHFMEHMAFQGTEYRTSKEITSTIENVGGEFRATTWSQYTIFKNHLPIKQIPLSLDVLADMIRFPLFSPELIAGEAKVVAQEIYASLENPQRITRNALLRAMYGEDPLANVTLGTIENINNFTQKDFFSYHKEHYLTSDLVISLAGKIPIDETLKKIETVFGEIAQKPGPAKWEKPSFLNNKIVTQKDFKQVHLTLGLPGYPVYSEKAIILRLLSSLFGGNMSSRLFRRLRYEEPLVYNVISYPISYTNAGYLAISVETSPENKERVQQILEEEITSLRQNKITSEELEHAKITVFGEKLVELEGSENRMEENACSIYLRDYVYTAKELTEQIFGVTLEKTEEVIRETFDLSKMAMAIVQNS